MGFTADVTAASTAIRTAFTTHADVLERGSGSKEEWFALARSVHDIGSMPVARNNSFIGQQVVASMTVFERSGVDGAAAGIGHLREALTSADGYIGGFADDLPKFARREEFAAAVGIPF